MEEEIPRDKINHDHLPRLNDSAYRGNAIVHWTMAIHNRGVGWLNARFTARFCWLLLHLRIARCSQNSKKMTMAHLNVVTVLR